MVRRRICVLPFCYSLKETQTIGLIVESNRMAVSSGYIITAMQLICRK